MSGTRPAGGPAARAASRPATSPLSTGWTDTPAGTGSTGSFAAPETTDRTRSWNWVVRWIVAPIPESSIIRSTRCLTV